MSYLDLHDQNAKESSPKGSSGKWYELAPGPDDGRHWARDGAFFWIDEWEGVAEPIFADRLLGYDRHGRVNLDAEAFKGALDYLDEVCCRLAKADEPSMLFVVAPELPKVLLHDLQRGFPGKRDDLMSDLKALAAWCRAALRRWGSITVIGL